ncbi:MAG: L-histidine N(alpha)-methyltransferase [Myxococcaceae bacterium]
MSATDLELDLEVDVHLRPETLRQWMRDEAREGLSGSPKELSPKWLYDERGSLLFEEITRLPEYYPTRRERSILRERAREIARVSRAETLVELGSGSSEKTRILLSALRELGTLRTFVPFDVSESMLRSAARAIRREFPGLRVHAVVGDFERQLPPLPGSGRRLVAFLGGTIGNIKPAQRASFLREIASGLQVGDTFLLGTDLLKDHLRLHAAYNDREGVTAAFNLNALCVLNRELGANFDLRAFEHLARFDPKNGWIEMLLRSKCDQRVEIPGLELELALAKYEPLRTEVSCKFRPDQVEDELAAAGLRLLEWWTDDSGDFAVTLSTPGRSD